MYVIKRNGEQEPVHFDKITDRIRKLCYGLNTTYIDPAAISLKVIQGLYSGITTTELDQLAAETCAYSSTYHPDFSTLAARISVSNLHRQTESVFSRNVKRMYEYTHPKTGEAAPLVAESFYEAVMENANVLDNAIYYDRDYNFDYFGFKTLERSYLLKMHDKPCERPAQMFMRCAVGVHTQVIDGKAVLDVTEAINTYNLLSQKYFTHATPTLYNAGTPRPQLSSCFLVHMEDSIEHIFKTLKDCAQISKYAGGIGINIHDIRASKSYIRGTNGNSNGIVPMLRVFSDTARYVDQCFTPETIIYTVNGIKCIENVTDDDKVLCSDGSVQNVNKLVKHEYQGKMLKIQIKNSTFPVIVTPEHQLLSLKGQKKGLNFDVIRNRINKKIIKPEFFDAGELSDGDFVVFPIPKYEKDIIDMSEEDCRFYGIMIGDGHISFKTSGVRLGNKSKNATIIFVKKYLNDKNIHFNLQDEDTSTRIVWTTNNSSFKFTREFLYEDETNMDLLSKKIDSNMLHLPLNKIIQILRGIIETDGCVGEKELTIEMSSLNVIESVRYMLLRLGALSSGYERNRIGDISSYKNITTRRMTYVIRVPRIQEINCLFETSPKGCFFSYLKHENFIYSRIENIEEIDYNGNVYDFEIDSPHDYTVAHLGIAHNGGGKRKGSIACYIEPHHADIFDFLDLKKNNGKEEMRARDLFYALWISDLFMKRVEENGDWTLFCPNEAPGLSDCYGEEYEKLYIKYETEGRGRQTIKAQQLWFAILQSQIETGTPYMLYKDSANYKSNQRNLGTIKSSNLCVAPETYILTDKGQIQISQLENQEVNVWNGEQWSKTKVVKTGENQKLITVVLSNGSRITCTPYHKFIISDNTNIKEFISNRIDASQLKSGMSVISINDNLESKIVSIVNIIDEGRYDDTYCFNEPLNHAGVFNGILTGNCSEIIEYTSKDETAVCNLASIALNSYVKSGKEFNYEKLYEVTKVITKNLNKVIDINFYPIPEAENSNRRHRPIGIGVQGLADTFAMLKYPFDSPDAAQLNRSIFETIYHAALTASCELAKKYGPYSSFREPTPSPAAQGLLQFDLWSVKPNSDTNLGPVYDWDTLKENIKTHGLRNSLLLAPMPTASTAQILGNNESIEPFTSNLYTRSCLSGNFIVVNKHLLKDLIDLNLWNERMRMQIISEKGSIQNIPGIPQKLKDLYKTVWEMKMKTLIDMSADRGAYICQSQSLNLFVADPTVSKLTSMHFYAWKRGLKTGMYYLRTRPKADAIQFTVDKEMIKSPKDSGFGTSSESKDSLSPGIILKNDSKGLEDPGIAEPIDPIKSKAEEAARKRQAIREAMKRGDFSFENEECINCGS